MRHHRLPYCAVFLVGLCAVIDLSTDLTRWLEFDMNASQRGEFWRPLTGHFCHYNVSHFIGDVAAFLFWASVVEVLSRRLLVAALFGTPLVLAAWLFLFSATPIRYRGLSAIDCALATQLFVVTITHSRVQATPWLRSTFYGVAALLVFKSGFEFVTGHAILAPELGAGVQLLPVSHVVGMGVGLVTALGQFRRGWDRKANPVSRSFTTVQTEACVLP